MPIGLRMNKPAQNNCATLPISGKNVLSPNGQISRVQQRINQDWEVAR